MSYNDVLIKLIEKLPTHYLMFLTTIIVFYFILKGICKGQLSLITKQLNKWKVKDNYKYNQINDKLDNLDERINHNTEMINELINKKKKVKNEK